MALFPPAADLSFDIGEGRMWADPEIMETGRVSVEAYTSEERFERERELFGRVWLQLGRVEEIPSPGDWIVREIEVRSASVLIVRGKDMKVRAFHNVCSHRAMKLVWDGKGHGSRFTCPYHAWMYTSEGELAHIPAADCFPDVDRAESGLTPIACDIWEGFICVNLDPQPRQTLLEFIGPVAERLAGAPFGDYTCGFTLSSEVEANWKFGIEAASEGYHVQVLHSKSVGNSLGSADNPHVHFMAWEPLGPHRMGSVPRNLEYALPQDRIVKAFVGRNFVAHRPEVGADQSASPTGFPGHPGINPTGSPDWMSDQFMMFPNWSIHTARSGWWTTAYWPLSRTRSLWRSTWFYRPPESLRERFGLHQSAASNRDVVSEDNSCFQRQQKAMESGARRFIQFGEQEMLLRHMAAVIETAIGPRRGRLSVAAE
jgi:phenylpropionate dioxygenase-like ring-hydroxylating dioxygenase large terminal subunit